MMVLLIFMMFVVRLVFFFVMFSNFAVFGGFGLVFGRMRVRHSGFGGWNHRRGKSKRSDSQGQDQLFHNF